jgi:hypothetical protein
MRCDDDDGLCVKTEGMYLRMFYFLFLHKEGNIGEKERKLLLSMKRKEENESMLDQSPSCR